MAAITITIPDAVAARVNDGFASYHGYQAMIPQPDGSTIPNPQSKAQFCKAKLMEYIRNSVAAYEAQQAARTAEQTALTTANNDITLT